MSQSCSTPENCTEPLQKECIVDSELSQDKFFCGCSPYYGFQGEDCTSASSLLVLNRLLLFIFLVGNVANLLLVAYFVKVLTKIRSNSIQQVYRLLSLVVLNAVGLILVLAAILIFIADAFDTSRMEILAVPSADAIVGRQRTILGHQLLVLPALSVLFSILITVLNWISLLRNVGATFPSSTQHIEFQIGRFLKVFIPISALVVGYAFLSLNVVLAFISSTIVATTVLLLYLFMLSAFLQPIKEVIEHSSGYSKASLEKSHRFILFSNRSLVAIYLLCLLGAALYGYSSDKYVSRIVQRRFEPAILSRLFVIFDLLVLYTFSNWYSWKLINNINAASLKS